VTTRPLGRLLGTRPLSPIPTHACDSLGTQMKQNPEILKTVALQRRLLGLLLGTRPLSLSPTRACDPLGTHKEIPNRENTALQ
jgi:hypothetical protein